MKRFKATTKRISVMLLAVLLMFSSVDYGVLSAAAAERTETTCPNHPEHTADCGYVEAVEGADCTHEHTDECYRTVTECVHEHGEECYEKELTCENTEEGHEHTDECYTKTLNCTHECSEESGCIKRELDCKHEHDENCGYREAVEGHPCTHSCELCSGAAEESTEDGTTDVEDERTCICEDKCTGDTVNEDCPICSAEGADLEKDCNGSLVYTLHNFTNDAAVTVKDAVACCGTAQYATAELKLNGYTAGAALNLATIETTSNTGFESISLEGFKVESDVKFDTIGNFDPTKTYYVTLRMPRSTGYELQEFL